MNKADAPNDTLCPEYKPSDFSGGLVCEKYAKQAAASNIIVLEPEVAAAFPHSAAVNDALRALLKVVKHAVAGARQGIDIVQTGGVNVLHQLRQ